MKIVISTSMYFKLSDSILFKLAERKGVTLYPERYDSGYVLYWTVPQDQWKICPEYNEDRLGYNEYVEYEHARNWEYIANGLSRDDKDLVALVEEMSTELADEHDSELHIVEIPDDVDWSLDSNDEHGGEWVVEKHRSWYYDANMPNGTRERPKPKSDATPSKNTSISNNKLIEILWSMSLSENMGDAVEAIKPILSHFDIETMSIPSLHEELVKRNLIPDYAKDDCIHNP